MTTANKLTLIKELPPSYDRFKLGLFKCECGNTKIAKLRDVKVNSIKSCGCIRKSRPTYRMKKTGTYISWTQMKSRCDNTKASQYPVYGGAGVTYHPRWKVFANFLEDMGVRPEGTSLSRLGDTGNYEPGNVVWGNKEHQHKQAKIKRST